MKILYLTNLIPCPSKPVGGIFTYKRIERLKNDYSEIEMKIIFPDSIVRKPFPFFHWKKDYNFSDIGLIDKKINVKKYLEHFKYGLNHLARQVIEFKKEFDYDLIHVHWTYPFSYVAKLVKSLINIPYIVTCQGSDIHNLMLRPGHRKMIIEGLKDADKVIFVSNSLYEFAEKHGYGEDNYQIITNGIDPEVFKLNKEIRIFDNDFPVIGYISDFSIVKGGDMVPAIINAIDTRLNGKVNFLFVLKSRFGKFPGEEIKVKNDRLKVVRSVPYNKMGELYASMKLLLMPSRQEGWPCTSIEALACGVPVLGSNIPPLLEVVPKSFGAFVDLDQPLERISENYSKIAENMLNCNYDINAMNQYSMKYSWQSIVKSETDLYCECLK